MGAVRCETDDPKFSLFSQNLSPGTLQKYYSENTLREEVEQRELEYKKQIQLVKEEMERSQKHLLEAQRTIEKLQQQLDELQRSKEEREFQRNELRKMMERLEQSKNMEAAERHRLEEEIREKHEEVLRIQEARRLQEEVEEANRKEEKYRQQQLEEGARREEEERQRQLQEQELEWVRERADTSFPEWQQIIDQLKEQLKDNLETTKHDEEETNLDKTHRINVAEGRDQYNTLADIRRGNTVRRVEMFENM